MERTYLFYRDSLLVQPQIPRDNLIGLLKDRLGPGRRVILIEGPAQSGKTTLLAQFTNTYRDQCFSFFLGTTIPNSDAGSFLIDLCEQMGWALHQKTDHLDDLDTTELKQVYFGFYRRVAQKAKASRQPIFFVIDGIEWLPKDHHEQEILSLLPTEPYPYVFLMGSSVPNRSFAFNYDAWELPFFSKGETKTYFSGVNLSKEHILQIHDQGSGMPGYLSIIRQHVSAGHYSQDDFNRLPKDLEGLFNLEWQRIDTSRRDFLLTLAVIAFSKGQLTERDLQEVVLTFDNADSPLVRTPFLRQDRRTQAIQFVSPGYFALGDRFSRFGPRCSIECKIRNAISDQEHDRVAIADANAIADPDTPQSPLRDREARRMVPRVRSQILPLKSQIKELCH